MQGNIVTAAKWFGGCLLLSTLIFTSGLCWSVLGSAEQIRKGLSYGATTRTRNHTGQLSIRIPEQIKLGPITVQADE